MFFQFYLLKGELRIFDVKNKRKWDYYKKK